MVGPFLASNNLSSTTWDAALKSPLHFIDTRWSLITTICDTISQNVPAWLHELCKLY
jgi:hypothetical protein